MNVVGKLKNTFVEHVPDLNWELHLYWTISFPVALMNEQGYLVLPCSCDNGLSSYQSVDTDHLMSMVTTETTKLKTKKLALFY